VFAVVVLGMFALSIFFFRGHFRQAVEYRARPPVAAKTLVERLVKMFRRDGDWVNREGNDVDSCRHFCAAFDDYSTRAPWFALVELATSALLGAAAAMTKVAGCPGLAYGAVSLYVAYIIVLVYFHPHSRQFDFVFTLVLAVAQCVVSVLVVLMLNGGGTGLNAAVEVITVAVMFLLVVRGGYDGLITIRDECFNQVRRQILMSRRPVDEQVLRVMGDLMAPLPLEPVQEPLAEPEPSAPPPQQPPPQQPPRPPPPPVQPAHRIEQYQTPVLRYLHHEEGAQPLLNIPLRRSPTPPDDAPVVRPDLNSVLDVPTRPTSPESSRRVIVPRRSPKPPRRTRPAAASPSAAAPTTTAPAARLPLTNAELDALLGITREETGVRLDIL
jgi:hypothetical protein